MLVFLKDFLDIAGHQEIHGPCVIIPIQLDSAIEVTGPILGEFILLFDTSDEVVDMLFADILDAEVIHDQCERYWSHFMFP
jgi:hypothetical protein